MSERQIARMADLEFLTELVQIIKTGIRTASPSALNMLYKNNDESFPDKENVMEKIHSGLGQIINLTEIHKTPLVSRANAYSLFAAFSAVQFPGLPVSGAIDAAMQGRPFVDKANILTNLTTLADAIESEIDGPFNEFVAAARQGTNTEKNRLTRFRWFHRGLTSDRV